MVKFGWRLRFVGYFGYVTIKSFSILDRDRVGIVLVVELGEQILLFHAEFPGWPCP